MVKPEGRNNFTEEPEIASYEELKLLLNDEKDTHIKKLLQEIEKLTENNQKLHGENENLQKDMISLIEYSNKLSDENSAFRDKLAHYRASKKKVRKEVKPDEKLIQIFTEFYEICLEEENINHYQLKQKIETHIKNLSDRDVLYFLLQQTIIYKRGMVILKEKEIIDGIRTKTVTWTQGTRLDKKTVSASLKTLESMQLILRYAKNRHKVIYFLNMEKCREIIELLKKKEADFEDVEEFLNVYLRSKKYTFFDFPVKVERGDPPLKRRRPSPLKEETLPFEGGDPPLSENAEKEATTDSQKLSTVPINNVLNDILNNKQTTIEDPGQNLPPEPKENLKQTLTENSLLNDLLKTWKLDQQSAASLLSRKGQKLSPSDYILALRTKITFMAEGVNELKASIGSDSAKKREKFFNMTDRTMNILNIQFTGSDTQELTREILSRIDNLKVE